jgi:hypothetical protein
VKKLMEAAPTLRSRCQGRLDRNPGAQRLRPGFGLDTGAKAHEGRVLAPNDRLRRPRRGEGQESSGRERGLIATFGVSDALVEKSSGVEAASAAQRQESHGCREASRLPAWKRL